MDLIKLLIKKSITINEQILKKPSFRKNLYDSAYGRYNKQKSYNRDQDLINKLQKSGFNPYLSEINRINRK